MEGQEDEKLKKQQQILKELEEQLKEAEEAKEQEDKLKQFLENELREAIFKLSEVEEVEKEFDQMMNSIEDEQNRDEEMIVENENQQLQNQQEIQQANQEEQEAQKESQDLNQDKKRVLNEISEAQESLQEAKQKGIKIEQDKKSVEDAKRKQEEEKKKMSSFFGFLSAIVSIFCPISGILVGVIGQLVSNGDFGKALQKVGEEQLNNLADTKKMQANISKCNKLLALDEEKFKQAVKKAQKSGSKIMEANMTKEGLSQKLSQYQNQLDRKTHDIQNIIQQKFANSNFIQNFKEIQNKVTGTLEKLNNNGLNLQILLRKVNSQKSTVKYLQENVKNKTQKQQNNNAQ